MTKPYRLLAGALALVAGACLFAPERIAGGGSFETTNGVVMGAVVREDGSPAAGVTVTMRPRGWLQDTGSVKTRLPADSTGKDTADLITAADGSFRIDSVRPGGYLLEARDSAAGLAVLFEAGVAKGDTARLGSMPLAGLAAVQGRVAASGPGGAAFVQVYGLKRVQKADSATGAFAFRDLPEGVYTLKVSRAGNVDPAILPGVVAQAAETTDVGPVILASFEEENYATWPYSRSLVLNTTSSGAGVGDTVMDFPVLIRLHRGNFDFARSGGKDIRFAGRGGRRLRYEIEKWDSAAGTAAVWVRVDTIWGNSNRNTLTLYWGKSGVPDWSNGRMVFDTALGYGGAWHLKESAPDTVADRLYADATPAGNHGADRIAGSDTSGIIGNGQFFSPTDYVRVRPVQSLKPSAQITVSAWFKASTTGSQGGDLLSMGDSYGLRVLQNGAWFFVPKGRDNWLSLNHQGGSLLDTAWHHLAGVYDGKQAVLYIDGAPAMTAPHTGALPYVMAPDFLIGRHGTGKSTFKFTGYLDEIRVSGVARSPAWIRLSFENQRVNGTLVEFK